MEAGVLELICNVKLTLNKFEKVRAPLIVSTEELHSLSVLNLQVRKNSMNKSYIIA